MKLFLFAALLALPNAAFAQNAVSSSDCQQVLEKLMIDMSDFGKLTQLLADQTKEPVGSSNRREVLEKQRAAMEEGMSLKSQIVSNCFAK